jgi:hypothetical protein
MRFTQGGKPLTRALIDFIKADESGRRPIRDFPPVRVITDDDGRCVVRDIRKDKYILNISYRQMFIPGIPIEVPPLNGKCEFEIGFEGRPPWERAFWRDCP